jgi:hypothetical protein
MNIQIIVLSLTPPKLLTIKPINTNYELSKESYYWRYHGKRWFPA